MAFSLNPRINRAKAAKDFAADGRAAIPNLLPEDQALKLLDHLKAREDWLQVINSGDRIFELDRSGRATMTPEKHAELDAAVYQGARSGFQYRYETIRVPDRLRDFSGPDDVLLDFARFLRSAEVLDLLGEIYGGQRPAFTDAQATAYSPGDFLTAHDDLVEGKDRIAAYVYGLSLDWRAEWGGLLLFHDSPGGAHALVPDFNKLVTFRVPCTHSVSLISPAAPRRRYSVTGWARSRLPVVDLTARA